MEEARALLQEAMPAQQPVAQTGLASLMVRARLCTLRVVLAASHMHGLSEAYLSGHVVCGPVPLSTLPSSEPCSRMWCSKPCSMLWPCAVLNPAQL